MNSRMAGLDPDGAEPSNTALQDGPIDTSDNITQETDPSAIELAIEAAVKQQSDADQVVHSVSSDENQSDTTDKQPASDSNEEEVHFDLHMTRGGNRESSYERDDDVATSRRKRSTMNGNRLRQSESPGDVKRKQEDEETLVTVQQITALREQLQKLEEKVTPNSRDEAVKDEWERDMNRFGPVGELDRWKNRRRQIHARLLRDSVTYDEGRKWIGDVAKEAERRMTDDLEHGMKVLKLRKKWEKKKRLENKMRTDHVSRLRLPDSNSDPDSESEGDSDSSWGEDDFRWKEEQERNRHKYELGLIRAELEWKQRKRQRKQRRREFEHNAQRTNIRSQYGVEDQRDDEARKSNIVPASSLPAKTRFRPTNPTNLLVLSATSELKRVPWDQFRVLRKGLEYDSSAIDILIGEPIIDFVGTSTHRQAQDKRDVSSHQPTPAASPLAERIRIHSREIIKILTKISGSGLTVGSAASVVIIRPFKNLVFYDEAIRAWHRKLCVKFTKMLHQESDSTDDNTEARPETEQSNKVGSTTQDKSDVDQDNGILKPREKPKIQESRDDQKKDGEKSNENVEESSEDDTNSQVAYDHLTCLLEFMDVDMAQRSKQLSSPGCEKIFFSDIWTLFRPGHHVIRNDGKQAYRILSVHGAAHNVVDPYHRWRSFRPTTRDEKMEGMYRIECVYLDYDGKRLGPISKTFMIDRFDGERRVTSLDIYPLRFHSQQRNEAEYMEDGKSEPKDREKTLRDYLCKRGKQFLRVSAVSPEKIQPMYYAGPALGTGDDVESQVVVDFEATFTTDEGSSRSSQAEEGHDMVNRAEWRPKLETLLGRDAKEDRYTVSCAAACCIQEYVHKDSYVDEKINEAFMDSLLLKSREQHGSPSVMVLPRLVDVKNIEAGLTEDDFVIMCYRVFGFILRNRKWAQLDLTYLADAKTTAVKRPDPADKTNVIEETTAFDHLVLPDGHSRMVLSLVAQHFRDKANSRQDRTDIVRGKGKGLILLLHGAPGVGKTTTAEGVAEKFKKPLFQLTCGDLGTVASEVEAALETNFALASRWGCILLLDEADVFLAQRTKEDFKRNGLVAVFLRVLEYYAGVLFLTTNRVGDFDEAFTSRIHISLYYPELNREHTLSILHLNLELIKSRFVSQTRKFIPDEIKIGDFVGKYFDDNPFDRWNGRQIRNICQTAFAQAEFDAQFDEKDPMMVKTPNADVELGVSHFERVANAYLDFSRYIRDLYGTHSARRAQEAGLRAMWVNDKGQVMGSVGPKDKLDRKTRYKMKGSGRYPQDAEVSQAQGAVGGQNAPSVPYYIHQVPNPQGYGRPTTPSQYAFQQSQPHVYNIPALPPQQSSYPYQPQPQAPVTGPEGYPSYQQQYPVDARYLHVPQHHHSAPPLQKPQPQYPQTAQLQQPKDRPGIGYECGPSQAGSADGRVPYVYSNPPSASGQRLGDPNAGQVGAGPAQGRPY